VNTNLDPEERYIREQRQKIMRQFLSKLSDKYKQMIELRFFEELSYQEIAEKLDLPVGTVKAQLFRAKELLYDILKDNHAGKSSF
jgi:RNA polymerase sigma-70 factor (ECF subfamily)